jgi:tetratricopeptide (TPR) repeat protein
MGIFDRFKKNDIISKNLTLELKAGELVKTFHFEEAISCLDQALKIDTSKENSDKIKSKLWLRKGNVWREWGQYFAKQEKFTEGMNCYSNAFECYYKSKKYSRYYDDFRYLDLGEAYGDLGNFYKAEKYFMNSRISAGHNISMDQYDHYQRAFWRIGKLKTLKRKNKKFPKIISFWKYGVKYDSYENYLVEFRFSGFAKQSIKELKTNITKKFGVTKRKIVPHITL